MQTENDLVAVARNAMVTSFTPIRQLVCLLTSVNLTDVDGDIVVVPAGIHVYAVIPASGVGDAFVVNRADQFRISSGWVSCSALALKRSFFFTRKDAVLPDPISPNLIDPVTAARNAVVTDCASMRQTMRLLHRVRLTTRDGVSVLIPAGVPVFATVPSGHVVFSTISLTSGEINEVDGPSVFVSRIGVHDEYAINNQSACSPSAMFQTLSGWVRYSVLTLTRPPTMKHFR